MADELAGKVALVTGASKNIGKGIALEVGASGAVTYLTARTVEDVPGQLASLAGPHRCRDRGVRRHRHPRRV